MNFINKYWPVIIGVAVGAAAGFLYWQQVGCASGTCPITASPLNSTAYGALMGGLLVSTFKKQHDKDIAER